MSATNETPYLKLPLFAATDKPTWLGDFNTAMTDIDTGVANVNNEVAKLPSQIAAANNTAAAAQTTANAAQTTANAAQTTANAAQTTANAANNIATSTAMDLQGVKDYLLNLTNKGTIPTSQISTSSNLSLNSAIISYALNKEGTYGKIYGQINAQVLDNSNGRYVTLKGVPIKKPSSEITMNFLGFQYSLIKTGNVNYMGISGMMLQPNGDIVLPLSNSPMPGYIILYELLAMPIYFEDFGDKPIPTNLTDPYEIMNMTLE